MGEAESVIMLFGGEFEGGKEGFRRVEGNIKDVLSPGRITGKACGVPGRLRPVTVP